MCAYLKMRLQVSGGLLIPNRQRPWHSHSFPSSLKRSFARRLELSFSLQFLQSVTMAFVGRSNQGSGSAVSSKGLILVLCVLLVAQSAAASNIVVGGSRGWTLGVNYNTWASKTTVRTRDTLVFKYSKLLHDVVVVTKTNFYNCNANRPLAKFKTGTDFVKFSKPGTHYVICGVPGHCKAGMKLAINVRA